MTAADSRSSPKSPDPLSSDSTGAAARDLPAVLPGPASRSPGSSAAGRRLALVIANGEYARDSGLAILSGPKRDAADLAAVLGDPGIGGFEVTAVLDRPSFEVQPALQRFLATARPDDLVVVYLSCHGLVDVHGQLYFAALNTDAELFEATAMEARWMLRRLDACLARRQVVILDCCYSGAFAEGARGTDADLRAQLIGSGRGRVVLTASRADQRSFENRGVGEQWAGVFTAGLVDGLRTGDADRDMDGLISVEDAYDHAEEFVRSNGGTQNPQRFMTEAEGRIYLARSRWGDAREPTPEATAPTRTLTAEPPSARATTRAGLKLQVNHTHTLSGHRGLVTDLALHRGRVADVAFSPDGELVATAGGDGSPRFWNSTTGEFLRWISPGSLYSPLSALAFSPDSALLATGGANTAVNLWSTIDCGHIRTLTGFSGGVRALAFSPDDTMLAGACDDGAVRLSNPSTGRMSRTFPTGGGPASAVAFGPYERILAAAGGDGNVRVWNISDGAGLHTLITEGPETLSLAFSPDGARLFTAGDGMVEIWDPTAGSRSGKLDCGDAFLVVCVRVSPDGRLLAAVSELGAVQLWDIRRAEIAATLSADDAAACAVAFHRHGRIMCTAGRDGRVYLWDLIHEVR